MSKVRFKQVLAVLGILGLILAIVALFNYHQAQLESRSLTIEQNVAQKSKKKLLSQAETLVTQLESQMNDENVKKAQEAVDRVDNQSDQDLLQKRINKVKERLAKKRENDQLKSQAEEAITTLEKNPTEDHLKKAQEAVDKLADKLSRERLQAKIDKVRRSIEVTQQQSSEVVLENDLVIENTETVPAMDVEYYNVPIQEEVVTVAEVLPVPETVPSENTNSLDNTASIDNVVIPPVSEVLSDELTD